MSGWTVGTFDGEIWVIPEKSGYSARRASCAKRQGPGQIQRYLEEIGAVRLEKLIACAEKAGLMGAVEVEK